MDSENAYEVVNTPDTDPPVYAEPVSPLLLPVAPTLSIPTLDSLQTPTPSTPEHTSTSTPTPTLDTESEIKSNMETVHELIASFLVKLMGTNDYKTEEDEEEDDEEDEDENDEEDEDENDEEDEDEDDDDDEDEEDSDMPSLVSDSDGEEPEDAKKIYLIQRGDHFRYETTYDNARKAVMNELFFFIGHNNISFYTIDNTKNDDGNTEEFVIMERRPESIYPFQMHQVFSVRLIIVDRYNMMKNIS